MKKLSLHRLLIALALSFAGTAVQAAVPVAAPQTVAIEFNQQNKMIVLGQDAGGTLTFKALLGTQYGSLVDSHGTAVDTSGGPVVIPKDASGQAVVYYNSNGTPKQVNPDYLVFQVENAGGEIDRALIQININLHPTVELFAENPQLNPSATPIGTASTFNAPLSIAVNTVTSLPSSTSDTDFITVWMRASDATGRMYVTSAKSLVDNLPPTLAWVQVPDDNSIVNGPVHFKLLAVDNIGIQDVRYRVDPISNNVDASVPQPVTPAPWVLNYNTTQLLDAVHVFNFVAVDRANLVSTSLQRSLNVDNVQPTVNLISPVDNSVLSSLTNIAADVADGIVTILVDGSPVATTFVAPNIYQLIQPITAPGAHTITVRAQDAAGNIIDRVTHITISPNPTYVVIQNSNLGNNMSGTFDIPITVTDVDGVKSVTVSVDGNPAVPAVHKAGDAYNYIFDTATLTDGNHTIKVTETNNNNVVHEQTVTVSVDNTPFVNVPVPANNGIVSGMQNIGVTPVPGTTLTSVEIYIDHTLKTTLNNPPFNYVLNTADGSTPDGTHTVVIHAKDANGDDTWLSRMVTTDNTPGLSVTIPGLIPGNSIVGNTTLRIPADVDIAQVRFVIDGTLTPVINPDPVSGNFDYSWNTVPLADGPHTIYATYSKKDNSTAQTPVLNPITDNSPPVVTAVLPTLEDETRGLYGQQIFRVTVQDPGNLPIDRVDFTLNTTLIASAPGHSNPTDNTYEFSLDTTKYSEGINQMIVVPVDKAGHTSQVVYNFNINNTNPPAAGHIAPHPASGAFVTSDDDSNIYATFDGAALSVGYLAQVKDDAITVYVTKDGADYRLAGESNYDAETGRLIFHTKIPDNAKVRWTVDVHDVDGKRYAGGPYPFTRAMAKDKGGTVTTADRRFQLVVPADALPEDMLVTIADEQTTSGIVNPNLGNFQTVNPEQSVVAGPFLISGLNAANVETVVIRKAAACSYSVPASEDDLNAPKVFQLAELFDNGKVFPLGSSKSATSSAQADPAGNKTINVPISRFGRFIITSQVLPEAGLTHFYNFPNPFNPKQGGTDFHYFLGADSSVKIMIYDLFGQQVRNIEIPMGATGGKIGLNLFNWDGKNGVGQVVANGGYIAHVVAEDARGNHSKAIYKVGVLK